MKVSSNNKTRCVYIRVRQTERRDNAITAPFGWPEMDEQNLIFVVIDDAGKFRTAPDKIAGSELALEH
jgi:hypothetical protein